MFNKLKKLIVRKATGRNVLFSFLCAQSIFALMLFYTIPKLDTLTGGMKILDVMPTGYSPNYIHTLFERLGVTGRAIYLYQQLALDMVYPLLFMISFTLLLTYIFQKTFASASLIHNFTLLPIAAGLFDYVENISIILMLSDYPDLSDSLAYSAATLTILKSLTTTLFFILLIIATFILGFQKIR